jgi:predicted nucleic acid-binding protein
MTVSTAVRTHCLDASALVKHYIEEKGSDALRAYLHGQANWYTTPFCLFEALSVLKAKGKNKTGMIALQKMNITTPALRCSRISTRD